MSGGAVRRGSRVSGLDVGQFDALVESHAVREVFADYVASDKAPDDVPVLGSVLVGRRSNWQIVIHGTDLDFRKIVCEVLESRANYGASFKYALCGRGDQVYSEKGGDHKISPKRCGRRECPRCSRYRGLKHVDKIRKVLSNGDHGFLYHMCFTQRVVAGECLLDSRERLVDKWGPMYRTLQGKFRMVGGMFTEHVVWSQRKGGWHVHLHLLAEFSQSLKREDVGRSWWGRLKKFDGGESFAPVFVRQVCAAGCAIEFGESQGELWRQGSSEVARAIEYPLRDVLSGIGDRLGALMDYESRRELVAEYMDGMQGRKTNRALGRWRGAVEEVEIDEAEKEKAEAAVIVAKAKIWRLLGTVDNVARDAESGNVAALSALGWLESASANNGKLGKRLVEFCRYFARVS